MIRCSPVDLRISLMIVEQYKKAGLDFVPVPVKNAKHRDELIAMGDKILDEIIEEAEGNGDTT